MLPNQISKIKYSKKTYILYINDNQYPIDEFYYESLLPYDNKVLEIKDMLDVIAFSKACLVLKKLYKKVFNHTISKYDFIGKLLAADISKEHIDLIVSKLVEEGYLDDDMFIAYYKELYQYNKGIKAFARFLEEHHISNYKINKALLDYNEDYDFAISYANRYVSSKVGSEKMLKMKLKANLINKGFSKTLINQVLSNIIIENEEDNLIKDIYKYYKKYPNKEDYYKMVSKLAAKGYNVSGIKKVVEKEGLYHED